MTVIIVTTAVACGLMGGIFFAFSTFVMKALRALPPNRGIEAMQAINITAASRPSCSPCSAPPWVAQWLV